MVPSRPVPVAPTVPEIPAATRKRTSFRIVAIVFAVLLAVGLAAAFIVYRKFVAYEPSVSKHVPAGAWLAARFDLTHVMLYEPFRRAVFPIVDRGAAGTPSRRDRLAEAGVVVGADVREVLVALGPNAQDWVVGVGGRLPKSGVPAVLAEVLRKEGRTVDAAGDGYVLRPEGIAFGQSGDGAVLFASEAGRLTAALQGQPPNPELNEGAGGLVATPASPVAGLSSFRAHWRAGSVVAVDAHGEFSGNPTLAMLALRLFLPTLGALDPTLSAPLQNAEVTAVGNSVEIKVQLPSEAMERLVAVAADRFPSF